jgi:hypothetical protein
MCIGGQLVIVKLKLSMYSNSIHFLLLFLFFSLHNFLKESLKPFAINTTMKSSSSGDDFESARTSEVGRVYNQKHKIK